MTVRMAEAGFIEFEELRVESGTGLEIRAIDYGSGISDPDLALTAGYSTSGGLGMGLTGTKQMMDEFAIQSELGRGTMITVRKWLDKR